MTVLDFQRRLETPAGKRLILKFNDNSSTMLSVKWEPDCTRISMHKKFLNAPQNVMDELACYVQTKNSKMAPTVKSFIETIVSELDYSHRTRLRKLEHKGQVYNLKEIYDKLNSEYFDNALSLYITWFGKASDSKNKSQISFGLYYNPLKLIKIHRRLDTPFFPEYVVAYIIYHEMLHEACPPYVDAKGINRVHHKAFQEREMQYCEYKRSRKWIRENSAIFFE